MFCGFFAAYSVLFKSTAGGPTAQQLFDLRNTALETAFLLTSTFTCGLASLAVGERSQKWTQIALLFTGLLGAAFLRSRSGSSRASSRAAPARAAAPSCPRSSPSSAAMGCT